ncbi:MAG TPA: sporulation protein [Gammaproteobacteria bacterium]|nr:sporulation protein [Gammaproteobacteria bacterium]
MDNQLKQRLVGAVVLVALAVIFIPMLLPGEGELGGIRGSNIPAEPDFRFPPVPAAPEAPPAPVAAKVPVGDHEPVALPAKKTESHSQPAAKPSPKPAKKTPAKMAKKSAPKTVTKAPAKTTSSTTDAAGAWVVQVGSFAARNNARALRDKLRKQGYASFVESISGKAGRVYRVRVGPELSKSAAETLRQRLAKEAGLKGLVQAYP